VPKLLVVDDDEDIRSTLEGVLADEGYTVEVAHDGRAAFQCLCNGPSPDAILLDLMMPVMNGWQFRARQLALPAFANIPIIVMSAVGNLEQAAITADEFLPKPIRLGALRATLERCLAADDQHADLLRQGTPEPEPEVGEMGWHLVAPRRGESCRWESGPRWVSIRMGEGEEMGMAVVDGSCGVRASFERYEEAVRFCTSLRD
jgi:CheY-like chemotaxis protein